jgi:phospholipid/cholesterol/gamma-HCH transport system permease protein
VERQYLPAGFRRLDGGVGGGAPSQDPDADAGNAGEPNRLASIRDIRIFFRPAVLVPSACWPMTSAVLHRADSLIQLLGSRVLDAVCFVGDLCLFAFRTLTWLIAQRPRGRMLWQVLHEVGVRSCPVVLTTGSFVGMILAIQTYDQFAVMQMENMLGTVLNLTVVKELGPVMVAIMLAGRVGSSMAAELGTMRVTEQIDALTALGANPIQYLVVPRFIACLVLIPLLTFVADGVGVISGWFVSSQLLGINSFFYWQHSLEFVRGYDIFTGFIKSILFGASIAVIGCHRGFHSKAGADGVGRAATEAFVYAFVAILLINLLVGTLMMGLDHLLLPAVKFV